MEKGGEIKRTIDKEIGKRKRVAGGGRGGEVEEVVKRKIKRTIHGITDKDEIGKRRRKRTRRDCKEENQETGWNNKMRKRSERGWRRL